MKYRKKPVEVEAWQWTGGNVNELRMLSGNIKSRSGVLVIHTLEGEMTAQLGDWIVRGVQGEFYPCKLDIFEATYELAEAPLPMESVRLDEGHAR